MLPPAVFEEAAHAGAGDRRGEAGHQALLPEEGHHQGRVQRDSAQGRSEGGCCLILLYALLNFDLVFFYLFDFIISFYCM